MKEREEESGRNEREGGNSEKMAPIRRRHLYQKPARSVQSAVSIKYRLVTASQTGKQTDILP